MFLLMADLILLLSIILITCGWVELIRIGAHFIFLGPASSWESYTAMIFLLTLLAQDYAQTQRGKWEREEVESCISIWLVVNCNDFDKSTFFDGWPRYFIIFIAFDLFFVLLCFVLRLLFCAFDLCLAFFLFVSLFSLFFVLFFWFAIFVLVLCFYFAFWLLFLVLCFGLWLFCFVLLFCFIIFFCLIFLCNDC